MRKHVKLTMLGLCLWMMFGNITGCGNENIGTSVGTANSIDTTDNEYLDNSTLSDSDVINNESTTNSDDNNENNTTQEEAAPRISLLTEVIVHNADGTSYTKEAYEYGDNGKLKTRKEYAEDGTCTETLYQYDDLGNKIKEEEFSHDGTLDASYEYDSNENLLNRYTYSDDGSIFYGKENEYTTDGTLMKSRFYSKRFYEEDWLTEFEQQFDDAGNLVYFYKRGNLNVWPETNHSIEEYLYDESGNVTREYQRYDYGYEDGRSSEVENRIEYVYDTNGRLAETLYLYFDFDNTNPDSRYKDKYVHEEYDSNGRVLSESYYWLWYMDPEILESKYEYEYDSKGRMTRKNQYNSSGELLFRTEYIHTDGTNYCKAFQYNNAGELVSVTECELDERTGKLINHMVIDGDPDIIGNFYEFDNANHLTKITRHTSEGEEILIYFAEYDENGILRKKQGTDYSQNPSAVEFSRTLETSIYDSNGNLVQFMEEYNDTVETTTYNKIGNKIEYKDESPEKQICIIFEYDENNNLISETASINGEPDYWIEYIYEYIDFE